MQIFFAVFKTFTAKGCYLWRIRVVIQGAIRRAFVTTVQSVSAYAHGRIILSRWRVGWLIISRPRAQGFRAIVCAFVRCLKRSRKENVCLQIQDTNISKILSEEKERMIKRACEYFSRVRKNFIYCETCRLRFDTKEQREEFCKKFCNKSGQENHCPIKRTLDEFYGKIDL